MWKAYRIYDYELWGNKREGFTVNYIFKGDLVFLTDAILEKDKQIIKWLKKVNIIKKHIHNSKITIDGERDFILWFNYCGDPSFEIRREEESDNLFLIYFYTKEIYYAKKTSNFPIS